MVYFEGLNAFAKFHSLTKSYVFVCFIVYLPGLYDLNAFWGLSGVSLLVCLQEREFRRRWSSTETARVCRARGRSAARALFSCRQEGHK